MEPNILKFQELTKKLESLETKVFSVFEQLNQKTKLKALKQQ